MNRFKILYAVGMALCLSIFNACESDEGYPDGDFSIVGTWRYHIPPVHGAAPVEGYLYNTDGIITFTSDMRFCFTLDTDRGEVKGYGRYRRDDTGIWLIYDRYALISECAHELGMLGILGESNFEIMAFGWGWDASLTGVSDVVKNDYMRVHTGRVNEYFRVETQAYEEVTEPYQVDPDGDFSYMTHDGGSLFDLPEKLQ